MGWCSGSSTASHSEVWLRFGCRSETIEAPVNGVSRLLLLPIIWCELRFACSIYLSMAARAYYCYHLILLIWNHNITYFLFAQSQCRCKFFQWIDGLEALNQDILWFPYDETESSPYNSFKRWVPPPNPPPMTDEEKMTAAEHRALNPPFCRCGLWRNLPA